ncbi:MAG: uracil-DNA glycosylase [Deltaproteobacteria bacterium]
MAGRINCFKCEYFYITWERYFQRGCRAHGIKTMDMPSAAVFRISGLECRLFELRGKRGGIKGGNDENA